MSESENNPEAMAQPTGEVKPEPTPLSGTGSVREGAAPPRAESPEDLKRMMAQALTPAEVLALVEKYRLFEESPETLTDVKRAMLEALRAGQHRDTLALIKTCVLLMRLNGDMGRAINKMNGGLQLMQQALAGLAHQKGGTVFIRRTSIDAVPDGAAVTVINVTDEHNRRYVMARLSYPKGTAPNQPILLTGTMPKLPDPPNGRHRFRGR